MAVNNKRYSIMVATILIIPGPGSRKQAAARMSSPDHTTLPAALPQPLDDGAADGLEGRLIRALTLPATDGRAVDLGVASEQTLVLYVYARTGVPGEPVPAEWDAIPGARGCTPESCSFRELAAEFRELGARVHGVGAQPLDEQRAFAEQHNLPYPLLNDSALELARALGLPTFEFGGRRYYRRLTLVAERRRVAKVFYPVFPPDTHAADVLAWVRRESRLSAARYDSV
jgi:peroxiredoxin